MIYPVLPKTTIGIDGDSVLIKYNLHAQLGFVPFHNPFNWHVLVRDPSISMKSVLQLY